jgi:hypothetical protein
MAMVPVHSLLVRGVLMLISHLVPALFMMSSILALHYHTKQTECVLGEVLVSPVVLYNLIEKDPLPPYSHQPGHVKMPH